MTIMVEITISILKKSANGSTEVIFMNAPDITPDCKIRKTPVTIHPNIEMPALTLLFLNTKSAIITNTNVESNASSGLNNPRLLSKSLTTALYISILFFKFQQYLITNRQSCRQF